MKNLNNLNRKEIKSFNEIMNTISFKRKALYIIMLSCAITYILTFAYFILNNL